MSTEILRYIRNLSLNSFLKALGSSKYIEPASLTSLRQAYKLLVLGLLATENSVLCLVPAFLQVEQVCVSGSNWAVQVALG